MDCFGVLSVEATCGVISGTCGYTVALGIVYKINHIAWIKQSRQEEVRAALHATQHQCHKRGHSTKWYQ